MRVAGIATVNRTDHPMFLELLQEAVIAAGQAGELLGLVVLKLGNLRRLNDSLGYRGADALMASAALKLHEELGPRARLVRIGAGRFAVVLLGLRDSAHALLAGHKIERILSAPLEFDSLAARLSPVQGIAVFPDHSSSAAGLMQRAESALSFAVRRGLPLHVFDGRDETEDAESLRVESFLESSLQAGKVETYFQPQLDIRKGRVTGAEALLRCRDDSGDMFSPESVVAAAERLHLASDMTYVIMNAALRNCVEWKEYIRCPRVAVNVSLSTLLDRDFIDSVVSILGLWGAEPANLTIEITESMFMEDPARSFNVMSALREMGISVAVDDFGTGYSSLSYFKSIPARELKIDRSFVIGLADDVANQKLVRTVISLAHEFELKVVAEGVEDVEALNLLQQYGCDAVQGFYFGRPMPGAQFIEWLQSRRD